MELFRKRKASKRQMERLFSDNSQPSTSTLSDTKKKVLGNGHSKIMRFAKAERLLHWALAGPFLVCLATGIILVAVYNPDPSRSYRSVFAILHRVSGCALIVLPMFVTLKRGGNASIHLYNIKQAWMWMCDDFKWLALIGLSAINSKVRLPEQGKFNAAEKVNFMVLMTTYPLYIATGLLMWFTHLPVLSWILHFMMAALSAPLILGHLYMALINRDTRPGLEGMVSGHVDRQWAKHHYGRWYREHHASAELQFLENLEENIGRLKSARLPDGKQDIPMNADPGTSFLEALRSERNGTEPAKKQQGNQALPSTHQ
jgi:formate dehydrogenase subunit gamma